MHYISNNFIEKVELPHVHQKCPLFFRIDPKFTATRDTRDPESVKIATGEDGCILSISAEFEDAKMIAQKTGVPVREVMRRIVDLAWINLV